MTSQKKPEIPQNSHLKFAKQSSKFSRTIYNLSKLSHEILLMAISSINASPNEQNSADIQIRDFAKAFHKENISTTQFNQQLTKAVMFELAKVICYENLESFYKNDAQHYVGTAYPLFLKAQIDTTRGIHLEFNARALENIQELKPYEIIEFDKAAKLQGKHAFNIYKYALSKQGYSGKSGNRTKTWWFEIDIDYLRAYLSVAKDTYKRNFAFQTRCVKEPVAEINSADIGIKIEFMPIKQGRKTTGFHFECTDTSKNRRIFKLDPPSVKLEKKELNEELLQEQEWARMESTFAEEWARYYGEVRESTPPGLFIESVARKKTFERMSDMGFRC